MIPTGEKSGKQVGMPDGRIAGASEKAKLPMTQLREGAREGDILPALAENTLVSVSTMANNNYATIFWPEGKGVEIYDLQEVNIQASGEPVVRGWRDQATGLWRIPMVDGASPPPCFEDFGKYVINLEKHQIANLHDLPSLPQRVAFIHACLGFPTKATFLEAARGGG